LSGERTRMEDFDVLSEMIRPAACLPLQQDYSHLTVTLTEPACPGCEVKIRGLPERSLVIKVDACPAPDSIFNGTKHECRRADYVIVAEQNGQTVVIFIELKTGTSSRRWEIVRQLMGARCFVEYCKAIGRHFWQARDFLEAAEQRFVRFSDRRSMLKRPSRPSRTKCLHNQPDDFLTLYGGCHVQFNELAALG